MIDVREEYLRSHPGSFARWRTRNGGGLPSDYRCDTVSDFLANSSAIPSGSRVQFPYLFYLSREQPRGLPNGLLLTGLQDNTGSFDAHVSSMRLLFSRVSPGERLYSPLLVKLSPRECDFYSVPAESLFLASFEVDDIDYMKPFWSPLLKRISSFFPRVSPKLAPT